MSQKIVRRIPAICLLLAMVCHSFINVQAQSDSLISLLEKTRGQDKRSLLIKQILNDASRGPTSISYAQMGLKEATEVNNKADQLYFSFELGNLHQFTHDSAYIYFIKAAGLAKELNDSSALGSIYIKLAIELESGHMLTGRENEHTVNPEALKYADSSIMIRKELSDTFPLINAMTRKAEILMYLGHMDKSKKVLDEVMGMYNLYQVPEERRSFGVITEFYLKNEQYDSALLCAMKDLRNRFNRADHPGVAYMHAMVAKIYSKLGKHDLSFEHGFKGLALTKKYNLSKERIDALDALSIAYETKGDYKNALAYRKELFNYTDSISSLKMREQVNAYDLKLQDERNQARIKLLTKDREIQKARERRQQAIQVSLIGALLSMTLLAILWFNRSKLKQRALVHSREQNAIIEKEKERSDELLLNILPAEIAEELKASGESHARDYRMVSILFTDFKEFTQTSVKLSAKELVEEINECFKVFDAICDKYNIEKIKTIGDSYMAAGGIPVPSENSVKDTVLAALEMAQFIAERKEQKELKNEIPFEMRIGIHTGPVVAGIVGVKKFQYDIWGDTVNTASRMESNGQEGKVNISENTYQLIKNDPQFVFEPRGKVEAKGKGMIEMYFVNLAEVKVLS